MSVRVSERERERERRQEATFKLRPTFEHSVQADNNIDVAAPQQLNHTLGIGTADLEVNFAVTSCEHSKRFGPEVLAEIRARAPQVRWAEVPASDHHITLDNPRGFVEVVRKFLSD